MLRARLYWKKRKLPSIVRLARAGGAACLARLGDGVAARARGHDGAHDGVEGDARGLPELQGPGAHLRNGCRSRDVAFVGSGLRCA